MISRHPARFRDRADAAAQLAAVLKERPLHDPLILGIPRGGVMIGAVLARELPGELDVVLARKLRAPYQPELAIGAIDEEGHVFISPYAEEMVESSEAYLKEEIKRQKEEIERRIILIRSVRERAPIAGRSVIVTDDGIATGSTMIAGLQTARAAKPRELIVAVPVASPDRLQEVRRWCDDVVCLMTPTEFYAIGQFYDDFTQVEDEEVLKALRESLVSAKTRSGGGS